MSSNLVRACASKAVLMMCDMQPVFAKTIQHMPHVVQTANTLLGAGKILNIPGVITEQYPEKLGHTLPELDTSNCRIFSKHSFTMMTKDVTDYLKTVECQDRDQYILMGIESHICITQTTLDILANRPQSTVFLVTDGISSSRLLDRSTALQRLSNAGAPHIVQTANSLIAASKVLDFPVVITEQYPEKLGKSVAGLDTTGCPIFPKTLFSMMTEDVKKHLSTHCRDRDQFILCGIEGHVCIMQTALDILTDRPDATLFLVTDGVSSSRLLDRTTAIDRLARAGAVLTTSESILFDMMRTKDHPRFKEISAIVRTINQRTPHESQLSSL
ncbi:Isochorismatase domain-containing protein 1 [Perkinsus chesapeaki]|uniref:Isochorismatase domain-containing protein 1 n=1 Tax=Perkinsus chesapeaki TaxID=330153 RepID=A0A7J6N009_PERCH|nr:Isochorismatase domain-containing protein 1 [Perkinsus chesapeaki]